MDTEDIQLPSKYKDYADVFSEEEASKFPDSTRVEHSIPIKEGVEVPYNPIYQLGEHKLGVLRDYLESSQEKGWIRKSESPASALILFILKKNSRLHLYIDYRGLNKVTIRNRHPLLLISETLDRLNRVKRFTKFDLYDIYYYIYIKRGDEWKTAFRTRYSYFEYTVIPFSLINASTTFQLYINKVLRGYLDIFYITYLDDIMMYSERVEDYKEHVRKVLKRLRQYNLYAKLSKCLFSIKELEFLGYIIGILGILIDYCRVVIIRDWLTSTIYREIQIFIKFSNFYRRFIIRYSVIIALMMNLLKGIEKGRKYGPFMWIVKVDQAFRLIKKCFQKASLLQHFNNCKPSQVESDTCITRLLDILL
jgi:Reverse transcriptase (RNA-dependent DNA polymerase)